LRIASLYDYSELLTECRCLLDFLLVKQRAAISEAASGYSLIQTNLLLAEILYYLSFIESKLGCTLLALQHMTESHSILTDHKDTDFVNRTQVAVNLRWLSCCQESNSKYSSAIQRYVEAERILELNRRNCPESYFDTVLYWLSNIQINLSHVYILTGRYDKALEYAEKSLGTSRNVMFRNPYIKCMCLCAVGKAYRCLKDLGLAVKYLNEAHALSESITNNEIKAHILSTLGGLYYSQGLYPPALLHFQRSLQVIPADMVPLRTQYMTNLGLTHIILGDTDKALFTLSQAITLHQQIDSPPYITMELYLALYLAWYNKGDRYKSWEYLIKAKTASDIIAAELSA